MRHAIVWWLLWGYLHSLLSWLVGNLCLWPHQVYCHWEVSKANVILVCQHRVLEADFFPVTVVEHLHIIC